MSTTAHQKAKRPSPIKGASPIVVPAPVATAFPPLKRRKTGQQCPITAAKATAAMSHSFCTVSLATTTGTSPLSMSPASVSTAAHFPAARSTFAVPMFPLPTFRTSTPRARPTRYPVGTEPRT